MKLTGNRKQRDERIYHKLALLAVWKSGKLLTRAEIQTFVREISVSRVREDKLTAAVYEKYLALISHTCRQLEQKINYEPIEVPNFKPVKTRRHKHFSTSPYM